MTFAFSPPKDPSEEEWFAFNYTGPLAERGPDVALLASPAPQIFVTVEQGVDASAGGLISGSPLVVGKRVFQKFKGGISGVKYRLACLAPTTDGQKLRLEGTLWVE